MPRIYLDNAATSWPKPDTVYDAVDRYQREFGAAAGRGAYRSAQESQRIITKTRAAGSKCLATGSGHLIFTSGGTASLNLAIHGLLKAGDHVITSVVEHNSVLRPLHWQMQNNQVDVTYVGCDSAGYIDLDELQRSFRANTRLVAITHASNVTGAVQPIAEIAQLTHNAEAIILVDAAQTAGCIPIDCSGWDVDLLACGGHKGLLGPLGTGLLYIRNGLEQSLQPILQGGTGGDSLSSQPPEESPEKFEAGNLNMPGIAGLGAALEYLSQRTDEDVQQHCRNLTSRLVDGLTTIAGITIHGPQVDQPRVAVVSCSAQGYDPQEFAAALDASCGVECRAGLHCAPKMHEALGIAETGGLIRFSPGWATTTAEIDSTLEAIAALASTPVH